MPSTSMMNTARRVVLAATIGAGAFVAAPSAASAAGTNACDASALQLSLLGGAALDPIHANPAYQPCVTADGSLVNVSGLLGLVSVQAVTATTRNTAKVKAQSESRVVGAQVGAAGPVVDRLTGPLLNGPNSIVGQVNGLVNGLLGPLTAPGGLLGGLLGSVPGVGGIVLGGVNNDALLPGLTGSLSSALTAALPDVLSAGVITAQAQATCSTTGTAQLSGTSRIADLRVLGVGVDANGAANQLLSLDTAKLNLGRLISPTQLLQSIQLTIQPGLVGSLLIGALGGNPLAPYNTNAHALLYADSGVVGLVNNLLGALLPGQSVGSIVTGLSTGLQPLLNAVEVNLPPGLLRAQVTPNAQSVVGDQLTQQALSLSVSALGQPILSGVLAQARVGAGAPGCASGTTGSGVKDPEKYSSPEAEAFLQCANRSVDLIDVFGQGNRTFVQGVAQRKYVGKTATIYLAHGKKKVGTVTVGEDGLFSKRVALPPKKIRLTNKARYYAVVDGKKTRALKFARRMETRGLTASSQNVTFRGRVVGPLQKRQQSVAIKQRISCKSYKTVATVKPDAKGNFTAKIKAPAGDGAAIYRAQTKVGRKKNAKRLSPTFTLPRVVGLS